VAESNNPSRLAEDQLLVPLFLLSGSWHHWGSRWPDGRSANAVLTTPLATCGSTWTPASGPHLNYQIIRAVTDTAGPAKPPEKRKVGGSTPPLTATSDLRIYAANDRFRFQQAACSLTSVSFIGSGRPHTRRSPQFRVSSAAQLASVGRRAAELHGRRPRGAELSTGTDRRRARSACLLAGRMPTNYSRSIRPPKSYRLPTPSPMQFSPGQHLARYWPTRQRPAGCRGTGRRRTSILRWRRCARSCCPRSAEDQ
jgi:hypothetical protein